MKICSTTKQFWFEFVVCAETTQSSWERKREWRLAAKKSGNFLTKCRVLNSFLTWLFHICSKEVMKRSLATIWGAADSSPQWQMVTTNVLLVPRKNGAFYDLVFQEVLRILGFSKSRLPNCYQDFTHFLFDSNQKDISAAFSLSPESFLMRMKEMKNVRKRRAGMWTLMFR